MAEMDDVLANLKADLARLLEEIPAVAVRGQDSDVVIEALRRIIGTIERLRAVGRGDK